MTCESQSTAVQARNYIKSLLLLPAALIKAFTLGICIVGVCLRVPDRLAIPQFWAEDGPILFVQAVSGGLTSLTEPHAGAFYTFQRIAALIVIQFPWEYAPAGFMTFAWFAFIATVLWCLSDRIRAPLVSRALMAIAVAYAPVKNETYLNLINAHWIISGLGLILLLLSETPKKRGGHIFDYSMCVLLGLTGPFCLIYLPLFALRVYFDADKHSKTLLALTILCSLVQIFQVGSREYELMGGELNPPVAQFLSVFTFRFLWTIIGYDTVGFHTLPLPIALTTAFAILAVFLFALWHAFRVGGYRWAVPFLASALVLGATFVEYREKPEALINAARYLFIPIIAFMWGLALAASARPFMFMPILAANLLVFLLHPSWREYDMPDLRWAESVHCLHADPDCIVEIHPRIFEFNVFPPPRGKIMKAHEVIARMRKNADVLKTRRQ